MNDITQSVYKAGRVLECLFQEGFQGKTINEICRQTSIDPQSIRRSLLTWKNLGWVIEVPIAGEKASCWKISRNLVEIAFAYEKDAMNRIHSIKNEFKTVTGKELIA